MALLFGGLAKAQTDTEDDLYEGFESSVNVATAGNAFGGSATAATQMSLFGAGVVPSTANRAPGASSYGRVPGSSMGRVPGTGMRLMTGQQGGPARPMTSVTSTGYRSTNDGQFNPLNMVDSSSAALAKLEVTKDDEARAMEKEVNSLIEAAAENGIKGKYGAALEKAKEAHKKERALCRHREQHGLADQINLDLTFAVAFNLANCYHQNGLYDQALQTYSIIVRNHQYPQAGRLKVNMGNIHYEQREYNQAIKMYRKALDQIPQTGKELRFKIFRNIGNAFIRLGQYQDAIQSYETIMAEMPDFQTAFNLILCYFALGDADRMRRGFQRTLSIPIPGLSDDADDDDDLDDVDEAEATGQKRVDGLRLELLSRRNDAHAVILTLAKLIAPKLEEGDLYKGYDWVINELKQDHERLASQMEIEKALHHMRNKEFQAAIDVLKSFEKRGQKLKAMAAVNLCFIYFLERDYEQADHYADMAMRHDRYNAKALVNKGNCFFVQENYLRAKEMYLEAVGVEADCVEAIYNLGLANIRLGAHSEAYQAFEKLHTLLPNNPEVLYQIANFHESMGELQSAAQTLNVLVARVPSDPGLLARLGQIYTKEEDESQAFHYHLESYRHYPVNLDVISWLGVWYVKSELYEKAIHFFERASQIQPQEPKWRLMVTSCYRRMGNYQRALQLYEELHEEYPENLECLRYIVAILKDMGRPYDEYQQKLNRLDRSAPANQVPSTRTEDLRPKAASSGKPSRGPPEKSRPVEDAPMAAPTAKKVNRGGSRPASTAPEDDDFDDEDVNDLLPTW